MSPTRCATTGCHFVTIRRIIRDIRFVTALVTPLYFCDLIRRGYYYAKLPQYYGISARGNLFESAAVYLNIEKFAKSNFKVREDKEREKDGDAVRKSGMRQVHTRAYMTE